MQALQKDSECLAWWWILALHLWPGLLIGATFVLLARMLAPSGRPANLALLLAMLVIAVPIELGTLLWLHRRTCGAWGISELIAYRSALPRRQAIILILLLFVWSVAAYTALAPAAELLRKFLFGWPDWLRLDGLAADLATTDRAEVATIVGLSLALNIMVPWVEELYFRGYLLPRTGRGGRWAPLLSAALFSLYHVWLPWEFFSRLAALLPAIYTVWWKRDLRVSIWVHVLLNSVGSVGLLVLALSNSTKI